jgi:hypothetical protein
MRVFRGLFFPGRETLGGHLRKAHRIALYQQACLPEQASRLSNYPAALIYPIVIWSPITEKS